MINKDLLPGHSLSLLHWLNSGLHSHVVIMVDTGHVPALLRPRRSLRDGRAHAFK